MSNKGLKDDYLIASREWHNGLHYPTWEGEPGGYLRVRSHETGFSSFSFTILPFCISFPFDDKFYQSNHAFAPQLFLQISST